MKQTNSTFASKQFSIEYQITRLLLSIRIKVNPVRIDFDTSVEGITVAKGA